MNLDGYTASERLMFAGFGLVFLIWAIVSVLVIVNRLLYDRRQRRLVDIARALADPTLEALPPLERSPAVRRSLRRLSRRAVYRMVASSEYPKWLTEVFAAYALEYLGPSRMLRDASNISWRSKWRRISALFALGHLRVSGVHELLEKAVLDRDPEVAAAAVTILHRLGDRRAAELLVSALGGSSGCSSRIASYLDQYPIPVYDLLLPLLRDTRPEVRYWSVSLLTRDPGNTDLSAQVARLTDDPDPHVRKAVLTTLCARAAPQAVPVARRHLSDTAAHVRSAAIRVLGLRGEGEPVPRRCEIASWIAPMLRDPIWEVRLAAKESLVRLGQDIWREVARQLDSADEFARNGAAEVLQNLGTLDWALTFVGAGVVPHAELQGVLTRAFEEGGPRMLAAARARQ
jgi:hypothetical protein